MCNVKVQKQAQDVLFHSQLEKWNEEKYLIKMSIAKWSKH